MSEVEPESSELEARLARLSPRGASPDVRQRILAAADKATPGSDSLPRWQRLPYGRLAAAALLAAVVLNIVAVQGDKARVARWRPPAWEPNARPLVQGERELQVWVDTRLNCAQQPQLQARIAQQRRALSKELTRETDS